jgi:hypothetical protein
MVEYFDWKTETNKQLGELTLKKVVWAVVWEILEHTHSTACWIYFWFKITQLCADINIVVEGRKLDDDGNVLLKFNNGANGILSPHKLLAEKKIV